MKLASKEIENNKVVKSVITKMGKNFGLTHKIYDTGENIIIQFFEKDSLYGEVTLKKNKLNNE